jgi:hypothetical protein
MGKEQTAARPCQSYACGLLLIVYSDYCDVRLAQWRKIGPFLVHVLGGKSKKGWYVRVAPALCLRVAVGISRDRCAFQPCHSFDHHHHPLDAKPFTSLLPPSALILTTARSPRPSPVDLVSDFCLVRPPPARHGRGRH